ncbi:MAG TPA: SDR family NAD(P)-dependent oxidoreductase, partial [Candidatus Limnocylindrales bacterium]|nr:SDR family NAD(P)-dependent oxidoreductase [Candidatus Limnocylindrales bacterium]
MALVTGGSRGLGRAIALAFAAQGADVAVNYRGNVAAADETVARIRAAGRLGEAIQGDTSAGREAAEAIVKAALDAFGRIDIMVNNAGIAQVNPIVDVQPDEVSKILAVNVEGVLWGIQAAAKKFQERGHGGKIINASSIAGHDGFAML